MIRFPSYTALSKPHILYRPHKKGNSDFFDNLNVSAKDKKDFREQIREIQITHQIDTSTTNIPAGKKVKQIMVLEIEFEQMDVSLTLLEQLDIRLGIYTAFVLKYPQGRDELLIHYKEPLGQEKDGKHFKIVRRFRTNDDVSIGFEGNDLDDVYESLVKETGKKELQVLEASNLRNSIELSDQLDKLDKKAQQLKKKMYSEKSMRKQMEIKRDYQATLKEIEDLKKQN
ncbi:DUF4391 domain-containing protein [Streptococcus mitis]|uniref:DUF4391 domain-containing protein n=1 Tax=Streptococcus TaxID=1301 RepID=UPI0008A8BB8D|nr:DUF4391 domain-containing protein [Streptococcus sp. HMSC063B03]OHP87856.1 hypothetical protein HMPREF2628_06975 [Streptococcus sp. HMSC063B03]